MTTTTLSFSEFKGAYHDYMLFINHYCAFIYEMFDKFTDDDYYVQYLRYLKYRKNK